MSMVIAAAFEYLGEEVLTMDSSSQDATLPAGTNFIEISAMGGDVYYCLNDDASAASGGVVPENMLRYVLKADNLTSIAFFGASPAKAHLIYRREP